MIIDVRMLKRLKSTGLNGVEGDFLGINANNEVDVLERKIFYGRAATGNNPMRWDTDQKNHSGFLLLNLNKSSLFFC